MFSINLLISSSLNVKEDMNKGLDQARNSISMLVSRDTSNLSEELANYICNCGSMTENITDSYVSYVFIFIVWFNWYLFRIKLLLCDIFSFNWNNNI